MDDYTHLIGTTWHINDTKGVFTVVAISGKYAIVENSRGTRRRILAHAVKSSKRKTGYTALPTPENVECPTCDGAGIYLGRPPQYDDTTCDRCHGTGRVTPENVETSCTICAGSGVIDANHFGDRMMIEPCFKCHGTGRVTPENVEEPT